MLDPAGGGFCQHQMALALVLWRLPKRP